MKSYIGIDISKSNLDVDLLGKAKQYCNSSVGIKNFINALKSHFKKSIDSVIIIVEASGGYEQCLVKACHAKGVAIHVAHANKVRAFAKSKGLLAKTDLLDATLLSQYGSVMQCHGDEVLLSKNAEKIKLLLGRREQLMADRQRERNRLDKLHDKDIKSSVDEHIKWFDKAIKGIDKELTKFSQAEDMKTTYTLLTSIPGIGALVANYLIANLPKLGKLDHKSISALVGVAPYNRDSGTLHGKRFIQGGRGQLRCILYMAAISAIQFNNDMKSFYQRLKSSGKPTKVVLVAVIRKLLTVINSVMKRQTPWIEKLEKKAKFS